MAGEQSIVSGMSGRYATALFELALEERALDQLRKDLDAFDTMVAENADLSRLIRSPVFGAEEQARALAAILKKAGIGGLAAGFLNVVAANRRLFAVPQMIRDFRKLVARHLGEVAAEVTVATTPDESHLQALKGALNTMTGKDVALSVKVDPAILGGLVVKLGSRMVDSSLRTKLNSIKYAMKEAR